VFATFALAGPRGLDGTLTSSGSFTAGNLAEFSSSSGTNLIDSGIAKASVKTTRTGIVREIWVDGGAITPSRTNGATTSSVETSTNKHTFDTLTFGNSIQQRGNFRLQFPSAWDGGTIKAKFYWLSPTGTASQTAIFGLKAVAVADGDAYDVAYGTGQTASKALSATTALQISGATPAITIAGSPTINKLVLFEVYRDVSDTLTVDVQLVGISIQYTETATEPTPW